MLYEYETLSHASDAEERMEQTPETVRDALKSGMVRDAATNGWELWQVNTVREPDSRTLVILMLRR